MEGILKGFPGNFKKIYERYFTKIYNFVFYKTRSTESAEDITSQTFLRAFERAATFDSSKGSVSAWLFKIALNTVNDHFRKNRCEANIDDLEQIGGSDTTEREIMDRELLGSVMEYLDSLPAKKKEIIVLRVWQNLSYRQIADITGMSEASCKMSFYRTIEEMREKLRPELALSFMIHIAALAACTSEAVK